jgi:hypothetical protein
VRYGALVAASCICTEGPENPEHGFWARAWAQNPVKVAVGRHRLIAENEDVRLLEVKRGAGAKTVMHSHI